MFAEERRKEILSQLRKKNRLTVKELSHFLNVSEATLRTDLNIMEKNGLLTRTHGGAVLNDVIHTKHSFSERSSKNNELKKTITNKAAPFIQDKSSIILDASTTALELARYLKESDLRLTVITNGLTTALELKENPNINVILLGGIARMGSMSLEGQLGKAILDQINIDMMFTSASGFTVKEGLTDFNVYEVELKKLMVEKAEKVIALIDHTKVGTSSIATFASIDQIDVIVTDKDLPEEMKTSLVHANVEVVD